MAAVPNPAANALHHLAAECNAARSSILNLQGNRSMKKFLVLAALACVLSTAQAAGNRTAVVEKPLVAQSLEAFNAEATHIRDQMQSGGVYGLMKAADRARVETRL